MSKRQRYLLRGAKMKKGKLPSFRNANWKFLEFSPYSVNLIAFEYHLFFIYLDEIYNKQKIYLPYRTAS